MKERLENIEELIKEHSPKAIIVTSPSYEGIVSDLPHISEVCKQNDVYLIVDESSHKYPKGYPFGYYSYLLLENF